jgi:hypothetical protein
MYDVCINWMKYFHVYINENILSQLYMHYMHDIYVQKIWTHERTIFTRLPLQKFGMGSLWYDHVNLWFFQFKLIEFQQIHSLGDWTKQGR